MSALAINLLLILDSQQPEEGMAIEGPDGGWEGADIEYGRIKGGEGPWAAQGRVQSIDRHLQDSKNKFCLFFSFRFEPLPDFSFYYFSLKISAPVPSSASVAQPKVPSASGMVEVGSSCDVCVRKQAERAARMTSGALEASLKPRWHL